MTQHGFAALLAAGQGRRLRPLSLAFPKPLLPLPGGTPTLYLLAQLRRAGFHHLALVTSPHPAWERFPGLPRQVHRLRQKPPFTLARGLATLATWVPPSARVLVVHADNLLHGSLEPLPEVLNREPAGRVRFTSDTTAATGVYWLPHQALQLAARHPDIDDLDTLWDLWRAHGLHPITVTLAGHRFNINTRMDYTQAHHYMLEHWSAFEPLAAWPGRFDPHHRSWVAHTAHVHRSHLVYTTVSPFAQVLESHLEDCVVAPYTIVHRARARERAFFVPPPPPPSE